MFAELILAIGSGVCAGIVTGLTPGVHINLVSLLVVSSTGFLLDYFSLLSLACFIVSMSVTHTFLDSIPGIFLGAPESDTVLGVLPGHRYLLKGNGYMALKLTLVGSFGALVLSVFLFPVFLFLTSHVYNLVKDYMGYILVAIAIFMILSDRMKLWASLVFLVSGALGYVVLNMVQSNNPLFPLLSGLFGIATLLVSLNGNESMPEQSYLDHTKLELSRTWKALVSGQFSGFLTAVLPGIGASTAALIAMQFCKKLGDHGFMILMGSVNTVNFTLSLATFYLLDKARNGSIIAVQDLVGEVDLWMVVLFLSVALIAGAIAFYLSFEIGKLFCRLISRVNYRFIVYIVIGFIILLTIFLSGPKGLLILATSTAVGLIPAVKKVRRINAMGCLMLPVILYFLG